MLPRCLQVDPLAPQPEIIALAADLLRQGELVAFPTETVYGLGANALSSVAVQKIFAAKGRPSHNPLIVHVADVHQARLATSDWTAMAEQLATAFWPGPLTLVLPKRANICAEVTAGGATVALRVPDHPVALALLAAAELPIAAPSANRSNRISPTRARHVMDDLAVHVPLVLDAGPAERGLESTVLDLSGQRPRVLRPGPITAEQLSTVLGQEVLHAATHGETIAAAPLLSPGMLRRHYAPHTPLELIEAGDTKPIQQLLASGQRAGWITSDSAALAAPREKLIIKRLPPEAAGYGAGLYAALHELDVAGVSRIFVTEPPQGPAWRAVQDRLRRAAAPRE